MEYVARFSKIPFSQWLEFFKENEKDTLFIEDINEEYLKSIWESIKIPERATDGSAGYDFYAPFDFLLERERITVVPTGINCTMMSDYHLSILPRSSSVKNGLEIVNTEGIIDSDYIGAKNNGHIIMYLTRRNVNDLQLPIYSSSFMAAENVIYVPSLKYKYNDSYLVKAGQGFCQGILLKQGYASNDEDVKERATRTGGYGSTDK